MDVRILQGLWAVAITFSVIFLLWYTNEIANRINQTLQVVSQFQQSQINFNQAVVNKLK